MENVPQRLGPYEIRGKIGSGGMGVVYLGWDARLNRQVAIKTLWPALAENVEARERFLREARAAAAISHPNVTQIHDIGEDGGQVYFAMEYLDGKSLQELLIQRGTLAADEIVSMARQAAAGLKAAAERGIIHRDVKPSNLVMTEEGTLKVTDFGLAKQQVAESNLTIEGQFVGTPDYISPEQAQGRALDLRSDIYSLGATMFELLGGRPPFVGNTPVSVVVQHLREPVPSLRHLNPHVPVPLAALVQRMLSKRPGARPQDYDQVIDQLDRIETICESDSAGARSTVDAIPAPAGESAEHGSNPGFAGRLFVAALAIIVLLVGAGVVLKHRDAGTGPAQKAPRTQRGPETPKPRDDAPEPARSRPVKPVSSPEAAGPATSQDRFSPAGRAELQFLDTRRELGQDGRLRIAGEVSNTGEGPASSIKIRIGLTNDVGQVLESTEVLLSPSRLGAGESGRYEAYFPNPPTRVQVRLEINWLS